MSYAEMFALASIFITLFGPAFVEQVVYDARPDASEAGMLFFFGAVIFLMIPCLVMMLVWPEWFTSIP